MKTDNIILVAPIKSLIVYFLGESRLRKAQTSYGHTSLVLAELIAAFLIMIVFLPIIIMQKSRSSQVLNTENYSASLS